MKKLLVSILFILVSITGFAQMDPGYVITDYTVDVTVHENHKLTVSEVIDVNFTETSHGIFRMIPTYTWVKRDVSDSQDGSQTRMMHYRAEVQNARASETWTDISSEYTDFFAMRMGEASVEFTGPHNYCITYDYYIYDDRVPQSDLFFYSVLGTGWDCEVKAFHFAVHFDKPLTDSQLSKFQLFIGPEGSHEDGRSTCVRTATNTDIEGDLYDVQPRSGATMFIPLHEGYFIKGTQPTLNQQLAYAFVILSFVLLFFVLKAELGRKGSYTKIISFHPPKGCTSADVGILIDETVDDRDIISLIPWLAEQGYITIETTDDNTILHFKDDLPKDAPDYLKTFFDGLFKHSSTFDVKKMPKDFGNAFIKAKSQAEGSFKGKLNIFNIKAAYVLCAAVFAASFAICFAGNNEDGWLWGGLTTVVFGGLAILRFVFSDSKSGGVSIMKILMYSIYLFFGCGFYVFVYFNNEDPTYIPAEFLMVLLVMLLVAAFLTPQLTFMSKYRCEKIGEIMGLEEFIRTAEKDQLQRLQDEDAKYFYSVLPYAVAFGLAEQWAEKFKDITIPPVDWYKGSLGNVQWIRPQSAFTQSLKQNISTAQAAARAAAARSSSGGSYSSSSSYSSGGGGYSGGGFGGGGGGRW